jgi:hypothetical protein
MVSVAAARGEFGRHAAQIWRPRGRIGPSPGQIYDGPRWGAGCDNVSSSGRWRRHRRATAAAGDVWPLGWRRGGAMLPPARRLGDTAADSLGARRCDNGWRWGRRQSFTSGRFRRRQCRLLQGAIVSGRWPTCGRPGVGGGVVRLATPAEWWCGGGALPRG